MLAAENRLTKEREIVAVLKGGKTFFSDNFILKTQEKKQKVSRGTFIISKKVAKKAVLRNKLKRRLREIIRKKIANFTKNIDFIIIVKKTTDPALSFKVITTEIDNLLKKAKLIQ